MRANLQPARERRERGAAVIEVAFLAPWIFFLFVAVLDYGFYNYAAITVENAARVAALACAQCAGSFSTATARTYVCNELQALPNVGTSCPTSVVSVTATQSAGPGDTGTQTNEVKVSVTYTTIPMIPLPFLTGQWTFTRFVEARQCKNCTCPPN